MENNASDGAYWQSFPTDIVGASNLLISHQQLDQSSSSLAPQQQLSQQWLDESDQRKWDQDFVMGDFNNNNHSDGDSPNSGSGRYGDFSSEGNLSQGGDQKQRRKEQNRAAQRAFRERKERYVKELQDKIKEMEKKHMDEMVRVTQENDALKALVKKMEAEIYTLKGAAMAFDMSLAKLRQPDSESPPLAQSDHLSTPSSNLMDATKHAVYNPNMDDDQNEEANFAERKTNRFDHQVDPMVLSGVKMVPYSQIWERLAQHPNFDEFDMDQLCEELKEKAKCSGTGPVIPESELKELLKRMDSMP